MVRSSDSDNPFENAKTNRAGGSKVETNLQYKVLRRIVFRRKNIDLFSKTDRYGHWWVEIYNIPRYSPSDINASYGWWPFIDEDRDGRGDVIGLWQTLTGVPGKLNDGALDGFDPDGNPGNTATMADESFHPMIKDSRTEDAVIEKIKIFAEGYDARGKTWAWPAFFSSSRSNCRVFQEEMMSELELFRSGMPVTWILSEESPVPGSPPEKKSK